MRLELDNQVKKLLQERNFWSKEISQAISKSDKPYTLLEAIEKLLILVNVEKEKLTSYLNRLTELPADEAFNLATAWAELDFNQRKDSQNLSQIFPQAFYGKINDEKWMQLLSEHPRIATDLAEEIMILALYKELTEETVAKALKFIQNNLEIRETLKALRAAELKDKWRFKPSHYPDYKIEERDKPYIQPRVYSEENKQLIRACDKIQAPAVAAKILRENQMKTARFSEILSAGSAQAFFNASISENSRQGEAPAEGFAPNL